ncbi:MAG: deoxyribose-phosphate aldolase [Candidatus Kapabacteria bacterium]|nr:deoxyribose-phosphate aldolase [Candidatus Kapabacteria bacterium]
MDLASYIDHTLLKPDSTAQQIDVLCAEARQYQFASVCILPWHVARATAILAGSDVLICTVIGFPLGATTTQAKISETLDAISRGASEIDMVASLTALKSGMHGDVLEDIRAVTVAAHDHGAIVKVIIETCLLNDAEKKQMCAIVTQAGSDFIKTSTGFSTGGATIEDVRLLREHVGAKVFVKASGGIRDRVSALAMIEAGAARLGTSSGVVILGSHERNNEIE